MNATLKERKELAKEVTACFLPFFLSFGGGSSTVHLIPCWAGAVQSRSPHGSAPPRIREGDVGEWENKALCNWQLFLK